VRNRALAARGFAVTVGKSRHRFVVPPPALVEQEDVHEPLRAIGSASGTNALWIELPRMSAMICGARARAPPQPNGGCVVTKGCEGKPG